MTETTHDTPEPYEIYAVKYAWRDATQNEHLIFKDPHDDPAMPMDYFVWAIVGKHKTWVLDSGFDRAEGEKRGRTFHRLPAEGLRMIGVEAERVEDLIISHLHYDHVGTWDHFPKAKLYLQEAEMQFATGRQMRHKSLRHSFTVGHIEGVIRALYDDRLEFADKEHQLAPGLSLHHVGGHTVGLQIARVWTRRGWMVLGVDAAHYYMNFEEIRPYRTVHSVGDMLEGYRVMARLADSPKHIIPGHDPLVMQRYPAASKETEGIAVRLDADPLY
jgi:glyoxylase-like metal-dependent hydrolase (beta-lactamase superfamily II)